MPGLSGCSRAKNNQRKNWPAENGTRCIFQIGLSAPMTKKAGRFAPPYDFFSIVKVLGCRLSVADSRNGFVPHPKMFVGMNAVADREQAGIRPV